MQLRPIEYDAGAMPIMNGMYIPADCTDLEFARMRVTIAARSLDGSSWAICHGDRMCFSKSECDFIWESMPSGRSDEFIADTRFATAEEAFDFWRENMDRYIFGHDDIMGQWVNVDGKWERHELSDEQREKIAKYSKEKS